MNLGSMTIELAANTARLQRDMEASRRIVDSSAKEMQRSLEQVKQLFGGLFAGVTATAAVTKLVSVQRQFDALNSSLITVSGSASAAAQEFAWIKQFAATTPFQLNEVTGAFVKMKALGLDASQRSLASYGNTASAMGRGLNQMIEAVADAATGEFERLKEFGIKAKSEGDRVTFTFRGVATEVGKNAKEIADYLRELGENEFAGAMALRAATLDGAISNLADTWDELFRTVSQQGAGNLIFDSVTLANGAIKDAIDIIKSLNEVTGQNAKDAGAMSVIQEGLAVAFETVAVIGANVKYTLVQVGNELGGLAAQSVAILTGNFAQAASIRKDMIADGEQARREIDSTTARILGARAAAKRSAEDAAKLTPRQMMFGADGYGAAADRGGSGGKADEKALREALKRRQDILEGAAKAALERMKRYDEAERVADEAIAERQAVIAKAYAERHDASMRTVVGLADEVKRQREANEEIGLTSEQVTQLRLAREDLTLATLEEARAEAIRKGEAGSEIGLLGEQITLTRQLIDARRTGAAREAEVEGAKRVADEWKRTSDMIEQGLVDSLFRAAEAGKGIFASLRDALRGMFNNLVLRPVIQAAVGGIGLGGAGGAFAGGGGDAGSMLSSASSLAGLSGAAGAFGSFASTGLMSSLYGVGLGTSLGAAGSLASGGALAGGAGMAIGAVAPYALAAVGAYKAIRSLTRRRVTGSGIEGTLGGDAGFEGNSFEEFRRRLGRGGRNTSDLDPAFSGGVADAVNATRSAVSGYAEALGLPVDALRSYTQALRIDTRGLSAEQIQAKVADAVQAFSDGLAGTFGAALTDFSREGEATSVTIARLADSLTGANAVLRALGRSLLQVSAAGGDAASRLLEGFGGADAFGSAAGTYLQAFYSEAERATIATRQVQDALAAVGLSLPRTRAEFRALVESQDLMSNSGRAAYTALLQTAGAFDQVAAVAESAAQAQREAIEAANRIAIDAIETARAQARDIAEAWTSIGDTLLDEVRRIRGELANDPGGDFTELLAAARGGDQVAAGRLPEAARAYLESARSTSVTGADYAIAQARVAAGLSDVAAASQSRAAERIAAADLMSPVLQSAAIDAAVTPVSAPAPTNARDGEIAALVAQNEAMRAELRAALATIAANTAATARTLDRWDGDSLPPAYDLSNQA